MAAGPEDMDLTARFIDRSLHGLAVDGQRCVFRSKVITDSGRK